MMTVEGMISELLYNNEKKINNQIKMYSGFTKIVLNYILFKEIQLSKI